MTQTLDIKHLEEIGKAWGAQEVELWKDQSEKPMPQWTMGTYCGDLSDIPENLRDEADLIIDSVAREVWNAARD